MQNSFFAVASATCLLLCGPVTGLAGTMLWFTNTDCTKMTITRHKSASDQTLEAEVVVSEQTAVRELVDRINRLPVDGPEMIKMGPNADYTTIEFQCAGGAMDTIKFYEGRIKTPSTGFLPKKQHEHDAIVRDIDSLVNPQLDQPIYKSAGVPIKFKDFTITFQRHEHTPQEAGGPTIGPSNKNFYSVRGLKSANETVLSIFDGQLPAQPLHFAVGEKVYVLLTYLDSNGRRLSAKHFEVARKISNQR